MASLQSSVAEPAKLPITRKEKCSQVCDIACSRSSLFPWVLIVVTLGAGVLVSLLIYEALLNDELERLAALVTSSGVEGLYLARQRLSSISVLISTTTTAITIMDPADWNRNNSYRLSAVASGQVASLAWWETHSMADEMELNERVADLREEYGVDPDDDSIKLVIATATNQRKAASDFFGNGTTPVDCGPLIHRDGGCRLVQAGDTCVRNNSCVTFPAYLGTNIPMDAMGVGAVSSFVLLVDLSRIPSRAASMARSIVEKQAVTTAPVELIRGVGNAPGLSIWSPVFHRDRDCEGDPACIPPLRGVLTVVLLAEVVQTEIMASSQLEGLSWILYETESNNALASYRGITGPAPLSRSTLYEDVEPFVEEGYSFHFVQGFESLGRDWVFEVQASKSFIDDSISSVPVLALVFGLIATAILVSTSAIILFFQWYKVREGIRRVQARHDAELKVHETVLGYIHHELRSPLHIVTASIEEVIHTLKAANIPSLQEPLPTSQDVDDITAECSAASAPRTAGERLQEYLNEALDATATMTRHVDDMLDFGKLRRGDFEARFESVSVPQLLKRTVDAHRSLSTVPLSLDVSQFEETLKQAAAAKHVPALFCETDPGRLQQLIINGLTNAMKHTSSGEITTTAYLTRASSKPFTIEHGNSDTTTPHVSPRVSTEWPFYIHVRVTDSGEGLQGKPAESLFRPFVSYDMSTKTASSLHSTGLGLPICRTLARRLGGEVLLKDTGSGCEFDVFLPTRFTIKEPSASGVGMTPTLDDATSAISLEVKGTPTMEDAAQGLDSARAATETTTEDQVGVELPSLHILVVDDVAMNVKLASNMLRRNGCTISAISKGNFEQAVVHELQASGQLPCAVPVPQEVQPFDAVFLDIRLGEYNGLSIFSSVLAQAEEAGAKDALPPFIAMTASTTSSDTHLYRDAGFVGILSKPFRSKQVKETLQLLHNLRSTTSK